jgi:RNA polymerase sigma factor (sigma-70 family)
MPAATKEPNKQNTLASSATEQAFVQLIAEHQGLIHKVCHMYTREENARSDLFQEIVLQLWRAYGSFRGQAKITTWMYRVALNTAISGLRKEKRRPQASDLDVQTLQIPQAPYDPDQEEKRRYLYQAIAQLSEVEKAIVMLYLEEHSYDEIAEVIGITRNHVGVKLNRIKTKLAKLITPHFN